MPVHPAADRWDDEYRRGRYRGEPPIPFVQTIVELLQELPEVGRGRGLYVGCGNGRNFIPLIRRGLNVTGIDCSRVAVDQLVAELGGHPAPVSHAAFEQFDTDTGLAYVVAIQVFQHGTWHVAMSNFGKALRLLRPGGLLFCRVNSTSTDIILPHDVVERGRDGGFTIKYHEGPKRGLDIHFFCRDELSAITRLGCTWLIEPRERRTRRSDPATGSWSQWEFVARKNGAYAS